MTLTEQAAGHPGALVTTALANVQRNADYALRYNATLLATQNWYWSISDHIYGTPADQLRTQAGASWQTYVPFLRAFCLLPAGTSHVDARITMAVSRTAQPGVLGTIVQASNASVVINPRVKVDAGGGIIDVGNTRQLYAADLTVTSNKAVATVGKGHGVRVFRSVYTSGFSDNVSASSPSHVSEFTEDTISFSMVSSNGSKGDGYLVLPAEVAIDKLDDLDHVVHPFFGASSIVHADGSVYLSNFTSLTHQTLVEIRVDARVRWQAGISFALTHTPLLCQVWAIRDSR